MWGHWLGRTTESEIRQPTTPFRRKSWHLSVLFRTNQLFQELLFKLVSLKFLTNVQTESNPLFQIKSPLEKFKTKLCKMSPFKGTIYESLKDFFSKLFSCKLARYFRVSCHQNLCGTSKVSQG